MQTKNLLQAIQSYDEFEASDGEELSPFLDKNGIEMDASEHIIALSETAEVAAQATMKTAEPEKNDSGKKGDDDTKKAMQQRMLLLQWQILLGKIKLITLFQCCRHLMGT